MNRGKGLALLFLLGGAVVASVATFALSFADRTPAPPPAVQLGRLDQARAAYLDRDFASAEKILRDLLRDHSGDRKARLLLGRLLADRGRLAEAKDSFEALVKVDPKDVEALRGLGQALRSLGQAGAAARTLQSAVDLRKDDPSLWRELGLAQRDAGDTFGAFSSVQKSLALDPEQADLQLLLGELARPTVEPALPGQKPRTGFDPASLSIPDPNRGPNRPRAPGVDPLMPPSGRGAPR
jgi:predicted Zn-dependent protease